MDLIERQDAINYMREYRHTNVSAETIMNMIPSAEKTGKWTLFKDKMPPETGRYFITLDLGYAKNLVSNDVWILRDCEWSVYDNEDVLAWMPIEYPEQYRKVTNESAD